MRILPWSLMTAVLLGAASSATAAPMTKLEREQLVAHLEMTERWLGLELKGLSEAQDELRTHAVQKSKTDLYQWLLMISTHSQRHLLQIQEIKASAGYPARQTR